MVSVQPLVPDFSNKPFEGYEGDALETILGLKAGGVLIDTVVCSPPYFCQRKYGNDSKELGQEKKVSEFIQALVRVFQEIPLQPWGSLWVNIGNKRGGKGELLGVPNRFAVAMQDAGFYLLDDVVWAKQVVSVDGTTAGQCMIEPATGRLNGNGWESFFHFVLDPKKVWSDTCAVHIPRDVSHFFQAGTHDPIPQTPYKTTMQCVSSEVGRNLTNVWLVNNSRKGNNHFAAYPETLVERPIAMSCPEWLVSDNGVLKPRTRIIDSTVYSEGSDNARMFGQYSLADSAPDESKLTPNEVERLEQLRKKSGRGDTARHYVPRYPRTVGWTFPDKPVVGPGIVLDPFCGTGTTGYVAILLGRRFIGVDLYGEVANRMVTRCKEAQAILIQRRPAVAIKVGSTLADMPASEPLAEIKTASVE